MSLLNLTFVIKKLPFTWHRRSLVKESGVLVVFMDLFGCLFGFLISLVTQLTLRNLAFLSDVGRRLNELPLNPIRNIWKGCLQARVHRNRTIFLNIIELRLLVFCPLFVELL